MVRITTALIPVWGGPADGQTVLDAGKRLLVGARYSDGRETRVPYRKVATSTGPRYELDLTRGPR